MRRRSFLMAAFSQSGGFHRGVNFTAEHPEVYGSEGARRMLRELKPHGVDSIALVPFGYTRPGTPSVRIQATRSWEPDDGVADLANLAKRLGLRVLLKPHIWIQGTYPGGLSFGSAEETEKWLNSYALFAEHYARLATRIRADLYCVGNEFVKLSRGKLEEGKWREIVARVRKLYGGPLTYAAVQGEEFEGLRFWDALDYIGLNNYYPLPDSLDTSAMVTRIETVQRRYAKKVLFTECGYPSLVAPHKEPWDESPRTLSMRDQARCTEALLKAVYEKSWMAGFYWWKVGSNGFGGEQDGSHTPWRKPAWRVIASYYRSARRR